MKDSNVLSLSDQELGALDDTLCDLVMEMRRGTSGVGLKVYADTAETAVRAIRELRAALAQQAQPLTDEMIREEAERWKQWARIDRDCVIKAMTWARDRMAQQAQPRCEGLVHRADDGTLWACSRPKHRADTECDYSVQVDDNEQPLSQQAQPLTHKVVNDALRALYRKQEHVNVADITDAVLALFAKETTQQAQPDRRKIIDELTQQSQDCGAYDPGRKNP